MNLISEVSGTVIKRGGINDQIRTMCISVGLALLSFANTSALAEDAEDSIKIRPQAGVGILDGGHSQHVGLRILFNASADKKYGMELTRMIASNAEYIVAGVILERKKYSWLNLSIGTVAYFGQSSGTKNLPGLLLNIGWEPDTTNAIKPFLTLRNEVLFADKTLAGYSVSAGFSVAY